MCPIKRTPVFVICYVEPLDVSKKSYSMFGFTFPFFILIDGLLRTVRNVFDMLLK